MQLRVERAPALDVRDPRRDDEAERLRLAPDGLAERAPGLPQREVERRRFERPAAVLGLPRLEDGERVERVAARERQLAAARLEALLGVGVVVDLLAAALFAAPRSTTAVRRSVNPRATSRSSGSSS